MQHGDKYVNAKFDDEKILDPETARYFKSHSLNKLLKIINQTLSEFGVEFDI
jgi:hypothetical protein